MNMKEIHPEASLHEAFVVGKESVRKWEKFLDEELEDLLGALIVKQHELEIRQEINFRSVLKNENRIVAEHEMLTGNNGANN